MSFNITNSYVLCNYIILQVLNYSVQNKNLYYKIILNCIWQYSKLIITNIMKVIYVQVLYQTSN